MLRTTIGLSFVLMVGGFAACSSKATDNDHDAGGNGAIVGGGTGPSAGSGGAFGSGTAGTVNVTPSAGTASSTAGTASAGGTTGGGACSGETVTCVDAKSAKGCNLETGVVETFNCVDEYAKLGFVSSGCSADATGEGCDVTSVSDPACQAGAQVFARCEGAMTDEQLFNVYVNCFQNNNDGHAVITCFSDFGTATTITANQCLQAEEKCFPSEGGAGPLEGAGGAP